MKKNLIFAALTGASLIALASPAAAQDSAATAPADTMATDDTVSEGNDIIVTAQRRAERVVDVPISITVASQEQLERQQVNSFNDLNRIAPSLEIQSAPGQNTGGGGAIRGIGTQTFSPGAVASVGVVVDQVSQGNASIGDIFDVARIEVLKGPQGTLFGLTTSAGVINITTNAPDPSGFSARVRTELSDEGTLGSGYGQQVVQGVVNIPVSSNAALRASGLMNLRQGVNRNALTGEWNDVNRYAVRGRFLWEPSDQLTVNLIGDYSKGTATGSGDFFTFVRTSGPGILPLPTPFPIEDTVGITARLASCGVTVREGNQDYCATQDLRQRSKNYGASLQVDYEADPFTLTSISAYRRSETSNAGTNIFRADPLEFQIVGGPENVKIDLYTQEFRVASPGNQTLEYTVGAFFSHQKSTQAPAFFNITLSPFPGLDIPIVRSLGSRNEVTDDSLAVFGQGTFHVTDAFRLIAGGRFTSARLGLNTFDVGAAVTRTQRLNVENVSYRFGAQYDINRNTMAYVTASRGYKGGQIAVPALPAEPFILQPEIPQAYEAGVKSTLFGGWIMDLNLFYQKVGNYQAQQCLSDPVTGGLSCIQTNIDGVKSKGAEINFFGRVTDGLSLNTGFIYTDVVYPDGYLGTDGTDIGGTQLAYSPKYKFTFSGEYEQPITSGINGFLAADAVWKSRLRYEANSVRESTYDPHWIVGGRIGVRSEDDRWSASIFARNLFNEHEPSLYQSGFPYGGASNVGAIYGPQSFRQVGLALEARF